jgi:hypothetical protein
VPDVSSITALDIAIGLSFFYLLLSIVCSAIQEVIARVANLRARDLEKGLRALLRDEEEVRAFYEHPRIRSLRDPSTGRMPSYVPSRAFALTVLDTLAPPDEKDEDEKDPKRDEIAHALERVRMVPSEPIRAVLEDAVRHADAARNRARAELELAFDDVMERASGWYKRRVQTILFVIAVVVTCALNADTFAIGDRLAKDDAVRAAVVAQAQKQTSATTCPVEDNGGTEPEARAADCVEQIEELGIPMGWTAETTPDNFEEGLAKFAGLLLTALALSLGAPFWFDLLNKVSNLRAAGKRPEADDTAKPQSGETPA